MSSNNSSSESKKSSEIIIYAVIAVFVFVICVLAGYVLEITASPKSGIKWEKALNVLPENMNFTGLIAAFKAVFAGTGIARKGAVFGLIGGGLIILYQLTKSPKRYHRRGEEHGSARWGNEQEKKALADLNDYYNNIIIAGDILLVLDRKIRELNKLTDKQKAEKEEKEKAEKAADKARIDSLVRKAEEHRNSPMGNLDEINEEKVEVFEISNGKLIRYNGSNESDVKLPEEIKIVGEYAFALNIDIKSVTLSENTEIIETGAFLGCEKLVAVTAFEKLKKIGVSAFENCYKLSEIHLPGRVNEFGDKAFNRCVNTTFYLPMNSPQEKYVLDNDFNSMLIGKDDTKLKVNDVLNNANRSKIKQMLNLNVMIFGGSGTGKSRFWVKPNLLQCNTSFVVTDPAGELLRDCGKMLERQGYKIKVFNLDDMKHSSNYNPFHYLKDSNGEYNPNNVIKMINTFMVNCNGENAGNSSDPFWDNATKLLLSAVCFLLVETAKEEEQNFSTVLELIRKCKVIEGREDEKSELDIIFDEHRKEKPDALSLQYYDEFKQAAGKTMQSVLINTTTKLQSFKLPDMRNLTFIDNIHLEEIGDEKTALFIIIPSSDDTFNFLAAMMYTQLFDVLYDRAINKFHGALPVHVQFLLDEFANVGKIPNFDKLLATMRKFEISSVIILQNLPQLKKMYEKNWSELPGNCDTLVFLGGMDEETTEYFSKKLGKETIDTLSVNVTKSKQGSTSYNDGILGRELLTTDELSKIDNSECIVAIRGMFPFRTSKSDVVNHPRYKLLNESGSKTYDVKQLKTKEEPISMDLSVFYDDNDIFVEESEIQITYVGQETDEADEYPESSSEIEGNAIAGLFAATIKI